MHMKNYSGVKNATTTTTKKSGACILEFLWKIIACCCGDEKIFWEDFFTEIKVETIFSPGCQKLVLDDDDKTIERKILI